MRERGKERATESGWRKREEERERERETERGRQKEKAQEREEGGWQKSGEATSEWERESVR